MVGMTEVKKSSTSKRPTQRRNKYMGLIVLIVIGLLFLTVSIWAWFYFVRNDPENTFKAMLNNNFRTSSVTRRVTQESGGQKLDQVIRFQNQSQHVAQSMTTVTQATEEGETVVVTETIGTPTHDYVRYVDIQTEQKSTSGKELAFEKVLNVWAVSDPVSEESLGDLYGDSALGVFPFADLTADQRNQLLQIIEANNVYEVNYGSTKQSTENGRTYYSYTVAVQPSSYIVMLKQFARDVGITQLENIDPKVYEGAQQLTFNVVVDVLSQRLVRISSVSGERQENFSGYGIHQEVTLPVNVIPVQELQQRLQTSTSV